VPIRPRDLRSRHLEAFQTARQSLALTVPGWGGPALTVTNG
jgi:hypothetical protein